MDEAEWLATDDVAEVLEGHPSWPKPNERKYRLFAVACCRRVEHLLLDPAVRRALEVAERHADGFASDGELDEAATQVMGCRQALNPSQYGAAETGPMGDWSDDWAAAGVQGCVSERGHRLVGDTAYHCEQAVSDYPGDEASTHEKGAQAGLLRDIIGPFRPVALDPTWRSPAVVALATAPYEERHLPAGTLDPARLAVLADALEEAGCDNADILSHLREPGPHVRGCWVVDLLLGKG